MGGLIYKNASFFKSSLYVLFNVNLQVTSNDVKYIWMTRKYKLFLQNVVEPPPKLI